MTAKERLRELLDARGVEWQGVEAVYWGDFDAIESVWKYGALDVTIYGITPEQAVEATLGRGTCHIEPFEMERDTGYFDTMQCECGHVADVADWAAWRFCPRCGREVVE